MILSFLPPLYSSQSRKSAGIPWIWRWKPPFFLYFYWGFTMFHSGQRWNCLHWIQFHMPRNLAWHARRNCCKCSTRCLPGFGLAPTIKKVQSWIPLRPSPSWRVEKEHKGSIDRSTCSNEICTYAWSCHFIQHLHPLTNAWICESQHCQNKWCFWIIKKEYPLVN